MFKKQPLSAQPQGEPKKSWKEILFGKRDKKYLLRNILIEIIFILVSVPTVAMGSSFTVSLIQGKSADEALQILAEQIYSLTGRMEIIETQQTMQEENIQTLQNTIEEQRQNITEQQSIIEQQKQTINEQQESIEKFQAQSQGAQSQLQETKSELKETQLKSELWAKKEAACKKADDINHDIPQRPKGVCGIWGATQTCRENFERNMESLSLPLPPGKDMTIEEYCQMEAEEGPCPCRGESLQEKQECFEKCFENCMNSLSRSPTGMVSGICYCRPSESGGVPYDTIEKIYNWEKDCPEHPDLKVIKPLYEQYLQAKKECDDLTTYYNNLK